MRQSEIARRIISKVQQCLTSSEVTFEKVELSGSRVMFDSVVDDLPSNHDYDISVTGVDDRGGLIHAIESQFHVLETKLEKSNWWGVSAEALLVVVKEREGGDATRIELHFLTSDFPTLYQDWPSLFSREELAWQVAVRRETADSKFYYAAKLNQFSEACWRLGACAAFFAIPDSVWRARVVVPRLKLHETIKQRIGSVWRSSKEPVVGVWRPLRLIPAELSANIRIPLEELCPPAPEWVAEAESVQYGSQALSGL